MVMEKIANQVSLNVQLYRIIIFAILILFSWHSHAENLSVTIQFSSEIAQQAGKKTADNTLFQHLSEQISELLTTAQERSRLIALAKNNTDKALQALGYHQANTHSALRKNIYAHLGDLPNTDEQRSSYIFLATDNTERALQALGYYQASITTELNKGESSKGNDKNWQLTITVTLNKATLVRTVAINISGEAKDDQAFKALLNNQSINKGDILHHGKYEEIKSSLVSLGLERGYFHGHMTNSKIAINQSFDYADVIINYDSGPRYKFGQVNFSPFELEPELLEALIPFNYGEYYTSKRLFQLQSQLQQSQFFSSAIAVPNKKGISDNNKLSAETGTTALGNHLPIDVALQKAKAHSFDFGIGYATDTEFRISAGWRTPLINRYGHSQETKIEYSKINPKARFNYSIPLSHPINNILQFQFTLNDDEYGDISSTFIDSKIANLQLFRNWSMQFYTRFLRERWTLNNTTTDVEYVLPGISFSKTRRKGPQLDPTSGLSQLYTFEAGSDSAKSAINVIRAYARWRYVTTLAPKHRLVVRGELGAAFIDDQQKDLLAPSLRFFAGGDQSIRGFAYQSLGSTQVIESEDGTSETLVVGGTRLAVASLEYQYYISDKVRGVLFTDGGNALDELDFKAVYSVGTGIHYLSPVGPIKLDFGYSISEENPGWRLHFTLGAEL